MGRSQEKEGSWQYQDHKTLVRVDQTLVGTSDILTRANDQKSKQGVAQTNNLKFTNCRQYKGHCSELQKNSVTNSLSWLPMYIYVTVHAKKEKSG